MTHTDRIKEAYSASGITRAAVIDELFDGPNLLSVPLWAEFQETALQSEEILGELGRRQITKSEIEYPSDPTLMRMWKNRANFGALTASAIADLFHDFNSRLADVEAAVDRLTSVGLNVTRLGAVRTNIPADVDVVFLDYNLESAQVDIDDRKSTAIAIKLAKRKEKIPFLVLFSDNSDLASVGREFREKTEYLGGTFAFMAKREAHDEPTFLYRLASFQIEKPGIKVIRTFFSTLAKHLDAVIDSVKKDVLRLDVQDYAVIQSLGLKEDGEPLGSYLVDLFGQVISHELRDGKRIQEARSKLDDFSFNEDFSYVDFPSLPVKRIYKAALLEPGIADAGPHPLSKPAASGIPNPPLLRTGDIFVTSKRVKRHAYVVVNPACDLQYSPQNPKRQPNLEYSVLLLVGLLEPFKPGCFSCSATRLEMIDIGKTTYRIVWDVDQVVSVALGDFGGWKTAGSYRRVSRLTLNHALSLQQKWASNVTRVGAPVPPPMFERCKLEAIYPNGENEWSEPLEPYEGAFVARIPKHGSDTERLFITSLGTDWLRKQLLQVIVISRESVDTLNQRAAEADASATGPESKNALQGKARKAGIMVGKLEELSANFEKWDQVTTKGLDVSSGTNIESVIPIKFHFSDDTRNVTRGGDFGLRVIVTRHVN